MLNKKILDNISFVSIHTVFLSWVYSFVHSTYFFKGHSDTVLGPSLPRHKQQQHFLLQE